MTAAFCCIFILLVQKLLNWVKVIDNELWITMYRLMLVSARSVFAVLDGYFLLC